MKSRIAVFMVLSVMICGGLSACGDEKKATPVETVTRNDGVAVPKSELEQICQDVVYNKAMIIKHTRESDPADKVKLCLSKSDYVCQRWFKFVKFRQINIRFW